MRFRLLGAIRLCEDGQETTVRAARERTVLAMLALRFNTVVPVDDLVDAIWGDTPPITARAQVHTCVSRLRRVMAQAGVPGGAVCTAPDGYVLRVRPGDLDLAEFGRLVARAREFAAAARPAEARGAYRAAIELWQGAAAADVTGAAVRIAAAGLDEQLLTAIEERTELDLRLGGAPDLVAELTTLVARNPLRERLRGQLMLALHAAGRQAEALEVYRQGRDVLDQQLGLQPGAYLRDVHRLVLTGGGGDATPVPPAGPRPEPEPAPASAPVRPEPVAASALPRDIGDFTARTAVVAHLLGATGSGTAPIIHVLNGMAGTGKTTLALHIAHLLAGRYPDGHLFIDLHGHSQERPVEAPVALDTLLRQLGIAGERIPDSLEARLELWRAHTATRAVLLVLDNAASAAQVEPLLPASANARVLITSRHRLTGIDGVRPVSLDVLDPGEAVRMLAAVAGERVNAESAAAAEVARLCGYLPLALRLAAARLAYRPQWTVAALADRLRQAGAALTELDVGGRSVAAAFELSYDHLDIASARMFRLLGMLPGPDVDVWAAAALAAVPVAEAGRLLETLVDANLVSEWCPGRYRLHDLLREYARHRAGTGRAGAGPGAETGPAGTGPADAGRRDAERRDAVGRLVDYYLAMAQAANGEFDEVSMAPGRAGDATAALVRRFDGFLAATSWLEVERFNLVAAVEAAGAMGLDRQAWQLTRALWRFLYQRAYDDDHARTFRIAFAAAGRLGDKAALATLHNYYGAALLRQGHWDEVLYHLDRAVALRSAAGLRLEQAASLGNLCTSYTMMGRYDEAIAHGLRAIEIYAEIGAWHMLARPAAMIGLAYMKLGRWEDALPLVRYSAAVLRRYHSQADLAAVLNNLGAIHRRLGHLKLASWLLNAAIRIWRSGGAPCSEAEGLAELGAVHRLTGRQAEAIAMQRGAIAILDEHGDQQRPGWARNELAETLLAGGERLAALGTYRDALAVATSSREPPEQARALAGIAAAIRVDDPGEATRYARRAREAYRRLHIGPEQQRALLPAEVAAALNDLAGPVPGGAAGSVGGGAAGSVGGGAAGSRARVPGQCSARATAAAAATTRGPTAAVSNGASATTPTLASRPSTPGTAAATPCAPG